VKYTAAPVRSIGGSFGALGVEPGERRPNLFGSEVRAVERRALSPPLLVRFEVVEVVSQIRQNLLRRFRKLPELRFVVVNQCFKQLERSHELPGI
jgi:hypothetical protein